MLCLIPLLNVSFHRRLKNLTGLRRFIFHPNPISQRHSIRKASAIFWLINPLFFFYLQCPDVFCHIYLWLPQHSEFIICKFGQRGAFSFPNKRTHGRHPRSPGDKAEPRVRHVFGCCESLTSSLEGQVNIWLSWCLVIEITPVSNVALWMPLNSSVLSAEVSHQERETV